MGSRKEREREFRRQLLAETALELFKEQSYETVTMQDIATAAECGKATLYQYFGSKEEFLAFILEQAQRDLVAQLELICSGSIPVLLELQTYIRLQYYFYLDYGPLILAMLRRKLEGTLNTALYQEASNYRDRKLSILGDILDRGINQGIFAGKDSFKLARGLHNMIRGFSLEVMEGDLPDRDPESDADLINQLLLNGIKAKVGDE